MDFFFWGGGDFRIAAQDLKLDRCTQLMKSIMMCEFSRSRSFHDFFFFFFFFFF